MTHREARPPAAPGRRRARPGRPLVLLCTGEPCGTCHEEAGAIAVQRWREAVRAVPGAVLVTTGCLGRCAGSDHSRAVAIVGWRHGEEQVVAAPLVFTGVDEPDTSAALADWMTGHATAPRAHPFESLPLRLRSHLVP